MPDAPIPRPISVVEVRVPLWPVVLPVSSTFIVSLPLPKTNREPAIPVVKPLVDGSMAVALYNRSDAPADVSVAAPEAEGELAVGFFGSRYERATPAEREYMRAMAATGDDPVPTSIVADELGRKPSSLSPARDGLIKKGLIYSSERGLIAFTVPHFGKFLCSQPI